MTQATGAAARPRPQPAGSGGRDGGMDTAVGGPLFGMPMDRSFEDMIAGRIRIRLAGQEWTLPVLSVAENEDWMASLDARTQEILADVDEDDLPAMMRAVVSLGVDQLLEFLYSYDKSGVLPRDPGFRGRCYPNEFLPAVWEVSLAANPTADLAVTAAVVGVRTLGQRAADAMADSAPSRPSPRSTAGRRKRSARN